MGKQLNIEEYFNGLEGDTWIDSITVLPDMAQVRDYTTREQSLVRRDFTVVDWSHDGVSCVDVYITQNGCITIYGEYEDESDLFLAVYTSTHADLRIEGDIPQSLSDAFLATATERMDYPE